MPVNKKSPPVRDPFESDHLQEEIRRHRHTGADIVGEPTDALKIELERERQFVLAFREGEDVMLGFKRLAREHGLGASHFQGIGALSDVVLGYFDCDKKEYARIELHEQVEVVSLSGNISRQEGVPKVHVHIAVARQDGSVLGGHLIEGHVRPTLEVFVTELPGVLERRADEETGLSLLDLEASRRPGKAA